MGSLTTEEALTASGTVQAHITDNHVLLGLEVAILGRVDDDAATRQTLTNIVVGVTVQLRDDTRGKEGTERLASGTLEAEVHMALREAIDTPLLGELVRQDRTHSTVSVADGEIGTHLLAGKE